MPSAVRSSLPVVESLHRSSAGDLNLTSHLKNCLNAHLPLSLHCLSLASSALSSPPADSLADARVYIGGRAPVRLRLLIRVELLQHFLPRRPSAPGSGSPSMSVAPNPPPSKLAPTTVSDQALEGRRRSRRVRRRMQPSVRVADM